MPDNVSMREESSDVPVLNLPNVLTVIRLVLVPVFVWLTWVGQSSTNAQWAALAVFCLAAITDRFDGQIARSRGLITDFGRIMDPIADKALTLGAFVMLSLTAALPWWFTILVAVRELGITWLRAALLKRGVVVSANSGGKAKTVTQMLFIVLALVPWSSFVPGVAHEVLTSWSHPLAWVVWAVGAVAFGLTMWSGAVYVAEGVRLSRGGRVEG